MNCLKFETPEHILYLSKVYPYSFMDIMLFYEKFKYYTGKKSYIAFELDLKRFLKCFNPDSINYYPIKKRF